MPLKEESQRSQPRPALLYIRSLESSHDAKFQERLIWLDEAWPFSTIKPLKCKVYIFHYVPLLCPLSTKREVNVVNNVPHSSAPGKIVGFEDQVAGALDGTEKRDGLLAQQIQVSKSKDIFRSPVFEKSIEGLRVFDVGLTNAKV